MAFEPASFDHKTKPSWSDLRYVVRGNTFNIMVSPKLAAKAGIQDGKGVRLDLDHERKLGRLMPVDRERRCFRQRTKGTMLAYWPWNGELPAAFPKSEGKNMTVALVVAEVTKSEGLIFDLPDRA
jgi:hypothetical protein